MRSKFCNTCKMERSLAQFRKDKGKKDGLSTQCSPCQKVRQREYYEKNREEIIRKSIEWGKRNPDSVWKRWHKQRGINITREEQQKIFESQDGCCAICKTKWIEGMPILFLDHNHHTGDVRGLLCRNCNTGLGQFKDSVDALLAAIEYLNSHALKSENK